MAEFGKAIVAEYIKNTLRTYRAENAADIARSTELAIVDSLDIR